MCIRDRTEDLFVNLWINRHSIDTSKSFNSYLHTIARNAAINFPKHKYVCDAYLNNNQETGYSSTSEEDLIAKELAPSRIQTRSRSGLRTAVRKAAKDAA